jgi:hypothetical protein
LRFLTCKSGCFMRSPSSLFVIQSGLKIFNIFLRHLLIKTCSLAECILYYYIGITHHNT